MFKDIQCFPVTLHVLISLKPDETPKLLSEYNIESLYYKVVISLRLLILI